MTMSSVSRASSRARQLPGETWHLSFPRTAHRLKLASTGSSSPKQCRVKTTLKNNKKLSGCGPAKSVSPPPVFKSCGFSLIFQRVNLGKCSRESYQLTVTTPAILVPDTNGDRCSLTKGWTLRCRALTHPQGGKIGGHKAIK